MASEDQARVNQTTGRDLFEADRARTAAEFGLPPERWEDADLACQQSWNIRAAQERTPFVPNWYELAQQAASSLPVSVPLQHDRVYEMFGKMQAEAYHLGRLHGSVHGRIRSGVTNDRPN